MSPCEAQILVVICGPVVLQSKVKSKIENIHKKSEKQKEHNHILCRLGSPERDECCVNFKVDPSNIINIIVSYRKVKVETGKFTEKSENQQKVTIIFPGEETHKIYTCCVN